MRGYIRSSCDYTSLPYKHRLFEPCFSDLNALASYYRYFFFSLYLQALYSHNPTMITLVTSIYRSSSDALKEREEKIQWRKITDPTYLTRRAISDYKRQQRRESMGRFLSHFGMPRFVLSRLLLCYYGLEFESLRKGQRKCHPHSGRGTYEEIGVRLKTRARSWSTEFHAGYKDVGFGVNVSSWE